MLFNSYVFIFAFLPVTLLGYFALSRYSQLAAAGGLALASVAFYAWGSPPAHVALLCASIVGNFAAGCGLARPIDPRSRQWILICAIAANLCALGYFKYSRFLLTTLGFAGATQPLLPLGISFFTFTQIAYLVDTYHKRTQGYHPAHYALFVTYFPHLIAGPVLYHAEMMPQFARGLGGRTKGRLVVLGLSIFAIGLAKKVLLADAAAPYADAIFNRASEFPLTMAEGWAGTVAYALQIYFDFSAYSDMAVGLSQMLGIRLPMNFNSPYKSKSIIDFWRTWHMTLSRFLRDYLYIPLGGNRRGSMRRYANLMITMLLGGLWHGAGWTFMIWGGLHGCFLIVNHLWRAARWLVLPGWMAHALTLFAVAVAWVFFRADSLPTASSVLWAMFGGNGIALPSSLQGSVPDTGHLAGLFHFGLFSNGIVAPFEALATIAVLGAIALAAPNTLEIFGRFRPVIEHVARIRNRWSWHPDAAWAIACALLFVGSLVMLSGDSPFLYFRF